MKEEKIVYISVDNITPYENNPRHNDETVAPLAKSIEQFGFKQPIVLDKNNVIIMGHTRYKAAHLLNLKTVPCIIASDLTDKQAKGLRIIDNKIQELSGWDFDRLDEEIQDLIKSDINFNLEDFGFEHIDEILSDDFFRDAEPHEKKHKKITCPYCNKEFEL